MSALGLRPKYRPFLAALGEYPRPRLFEELSHKIAHCQVACKAKIWYTFEVRFPLTSL